MNFRAQPRPGGLVGGDRPPPRGAAGERYSPRPQLSAAASRELHTWPAPCAGGPGAPPRSTATSGACEEMRGNEGVVPSRARLHGQAPPPGPAPPTTARLLPPTVRFCSLHAGPASHGQVPPSRARPFSLQPGHAHSPAPFCPKHCTESSTADKS